MFQPRTSRSRSTKLNLASNELKFLAEIPNMLRRNQSRFYGLAEAIDDTPSIEQNSFNSVILELLDKEPFLAI